MGGKSRQEPPRTPPKTRSITAEEKKKVSFTDDPNPFSPLLSQPLSRSPTPTRLPASPRPLKSPSPPTSQPSSPTLTLASDFITISSRIDTYSNWPHQYLSPTKLAAAGFYHLSTDDYLEDDAVECAFCGIQYSEWDDLDVPIKELMPEHEDNCPWPKLTADFFNHLPLITPPNTATPRTPNKNRTLTTPHTPKKPPPSRIPRLSPKCNLLPLQLPQPTNPQPSPQLSAHSPPPSPPASSPQPRTYATVLASPQPTQPNRLRQKPPGLVLTVQDLITRFRNKPSPFHQQLPVLQYDIAAAAVTNSLSKFLLSTLPAFTRFLSDIQGGQYIRHSPYWGGTEHRGTEMDSKRGRGPSNDTPIHLTHYTDLTHQSPRVTESRQRFSHRR
ncbi:hypothetical protein K469DRAFT_707607 [Zopfia rhizophila CBS 207.26]|uniref:Inhibitor of apoptosis repeat-containing protein n=1 Tax=Zopfia rhizophila CBS 207.26 TaxID=1314779 RepID=A0A6A6E590_9PEZI|nr:hypothetical protein K469DRAFT_707607 [Zopfia rhizophila CBS 207.26]